MSRSFRPMGDCAYRAAWCGADHKHLRRAAYLALALGAIAAGPSAFAQSASCEVTYTKAWEGGNGFGADIIVTNLGPAITNGWTLQFDFPDGQRLQHGWPVSFSQPANSATVTVASNAQWNENIASGGSFNIGFNGTFSGANGSPTQFTLNGTVCNGDEAENAAPTISLTSPTSGQTFAEGATVSVAATASDSDGEVVRVEFYVDGTLVATDTSAPYSFDASGLAAGDHTAQASAYDNGSPSLSTSTPEVPFTVQGGSSNLPPTISLTSPASGGTFPSGSAVTLSATASDPDGTVARVEFRVDGTLVSTDTSAPYSFDVTGLADGNHTAQATAFDDGTPSLSTATAAVAFSIGDGSPSDGVFRVDPTGQITKNGEPFNVRCGNWFGLEGRHEPSDDATNPSGAPMELYIGNTTWSNGGSGTGRTIQQTMTEITGMGINVVRLPVVPQTLDANNPQGREPYLKNHPSVRVPNSRQALEEFILAADQNNIEVLLDIHSCSNYVGWRAGRLDARPPYADATRENYDYTREEYSCAASGNPSSVTTTHPYNQSAWLDTLRTLAGLSEDLGVDNIIGIDLFNEPWDYTWDDWKSLTESAYQAISEVNDDVLIFVEGISATANNQDGSPDTITEVPHGSTDSNPNWGENLFEAGTNPLNVPKERLVYSPHTYGPSVFVQKMFMDPAQPECEGLEGDEAGDADCNIVINPTILRAGWEEHFGYLRDEGYAVVVGEFGGNMDWPLGQASLRDRERWSHITPGIDQEWQTAFVDYLVDKNIQGCYWSINPESGDTAGWYGHAYDPISNTAGWGTWLDFDQRKTNLLNTLWGN